MFYEIIYTKGQFWAAPFLYNETKAKKNLGIENETQELVWYWIEEKLGVRSPNVYITDEKVVFDRRAKNAQH